MMLVPAAHSGIDFNNRLTEDDSINPVDLEFMYNGGGIAVGDFNRDGLPDLYFTGNRVPNRLYLNEGHLHFRDATQQSGTGGEGEWANGATIIDINNDGWPDIYVCVSIYKDARRRRNLLYINQGCDKNGTPTFKEEAAEYGLADTSYSVQAAFFDYDNDGDLDLFLVTTKPAQRDVVQFNTNDDGPNIANHDKLFRNDFNARLGHPVYTDVSAQAGIVQAGYGLGVSIADLNRDGRKDIYVSNDFLSSDLCLVNNGDGTFTNKVKDYFKHTSQNAMGNDIADIDNDGWPDILTVDMNPPGNQRKKVNLGGGNYIFYRNMLYGNYMLQYVRNTLQWNRGPRRGPGDSLGDPVFSEIAFFAGVAETDWSWTPGLADIDNDGYRDILITNGYPRDVTDHDFTAFRQRSGASVPKKDLITQIPTVSIPNFAYRNRGDKTFEDVTLEWGMQRNSFSNGSVCVDLDNDGDLDYVVNNINETAFLYENTTNQATDSVPAPGWLDISFHGAPKNIDGIGAIAEVYYGGGKYATAENNPVRGYLSCVSPTLHFGLGKFHHVDSLRIDWGRGRTKMLKNLAGDQKLTVDFRNAGGTPTTKKPTPTSITPLFTDITSLAGIDYTHHEREFIDFNQERLLPHQFSQYGPGLAAADLNGDGLDDLLIGASGGQPIRSFYLQQPNGKFLRHDLPLSLDRRYPENSGLLLFDADGDHRIDIYCASGSNEFPVGAADYQDQLWLGDGHGGFQQDTTALPPNHASKSCVKAADFNRDGRPDLFVGGRVVPANYPTPATSALYRNDSRPGHPQFTDITDQVAPGLRSIGLVCDATWSDYDNDAWPDLIVVGEWMTIHFFHNEKGQLIDRTNSTDSNAPLPTGWWNSITAADIDNDGDMDYIVGNLGQNSFFRATPQHPLGIYAGDFDGNGTPDAIITVWLPDEHGNLTEFPFASRDELTGQLPILKKRFPTYAAYGHARLTDILDSRQLETARTYHAGELRSGWFENKGNGKFAFHPLPPEAQLAPIYGIVAADLDGDGNIDLALTGNDFGNEPGNGRYDAFNGLVLLGDGHGHFQPQTIAQSGLFIPGDGKALIALKGPTGGLLLAASQNGGPLKLFRANHTAASGPIRLQPTDVAAIIESKDGRVRREEPLWSGSFLSQSAPMISADSPTKKIEIINAAGARRVVYPNK